MVAPSFQSYEVVIAEPFEKKGKLYITVKHPSTGNNRDVRWYDEKEYAKAYGNKSSSSSGGWQLGQNAYPNGYLRARGFSQGPILLIRGNRASDEEWLKYSPACYATDFGWHIRSTEELPTDAPPHFRYLLLSWDEIKDPSDDTNNTPIPKTDRIKLINTKIRKGEYIKLC